MTIAVAEKSGNILKKDAEGYWYSLPPNQVDSFVYAVEETVNAEFMSSEWYSAWEEVNNNFGSYRLEV